MQYPESYLSISQLSPFEQTRITTEDIPSSRLTILDAALSPDTNCLSSDEPYEPYEPYVGDGEDTPDTYPLGDLENRYLMQMSHLR